jgi:flagellar protein FlaF
MQFSNADLPLAGPMGAGAIYGKVIRETENPREIERRVFERITGEMEAAGQPDAAFTARIVAMSRNRDLWLALTCDLADENNVLPAPLRARIISLGIWVLGETQRLLADERPLDDLIAINRCIIAGLAAASEGAS